MLRRPLPHHLPPSKQNGAEAEQTMSRCIHVTAFQFVLFVTQNQDEQPKFHEMSLSLTIPDAASPCRLKMHLTFDNRCPYFASSFCFFSW
jgi:hypothetical protein